MALHFINEASDRSATHFEDASLIQGVLARAEIPHELLALSYNIIARYAMVHAFQRISSPLRPDLLTVAAASLAVSYNDDHPPKSSWWSRWVCESRHSAAQIDAAISDVLFALDWRLHSLTAPHALERAMRLLFDEHSTEAIDTTPGARVNQVPQAKPEPLKIRIDGTAACWAHGQLTPDSSMPGSAVGHQPMNRFLPLL